MWLLIRYKKRKLKELCSILEKYKLIEGYHIPMLNLEGKELPAMLNYCFLEVEDIYGYRCDGCGKDFRAGADASACSECGSAEVRPTYGPREALLSELRSRRFPFIFTVESEISEAEVRKIAEYVEAKNANIPTGITVGDTVVLRSGAFNNFIADIVSMGESSCRVKLVEGLLGRDVEFEVEYRDIDKVGHF